MSKTMVCETFSYEPSVNGFRRCDNGLKNRRAPKGRVLDDKQMDFLRNKPYMYNCYVSSIMENLFLQKFWYSISRLVPLWIAPCTLTCLGLIINVVTSVILVYYSPDAKQSVPNWSFLSCAIGVFLYQVLDALDGKQAVKVQDTPIEEVYDHGCDAVTALFVTQSVAIATCLGNHPFMQFTFFLVPLIAFYMTHYSCHITHVMVFGRIDVIEGQWAMILVHIVTYMLGQQIWDRRVLFGYTITHVLFVATISSLLTSVVSNLWLVLGADSPMDKYIRIPRKMEHKWNPMTSLCILIASAVIAYHRNVFDANPLLFTLVFGLTFAKLSFKLQVMNVSHGHMAHLDTSIIGPIFLVINSYVQLMPLSASLWLTLCFALTDHCLYFVRASLDMKEALDLNIFSLKYPVGHDKCRNKNYGFNLNGTENSRAIKNMSQYSKLLNEVY